MASELVISGREDDAFTHLLLVGLASILEDDADERLECRIQWRGLADATITVNRASFDWMDCARIVHTHAERWLTSAWLNAKGSYTAGRDRATLNPTLGSLPSREAWQRLQKDRHSAIDGLQTVGDRRYIGSLGEPSYWSGKSKMKADHQDFGRTRWEMTPSNGGQRFVDGRLLPIAQKVTLRSPEQIADGLVGRTVTDEIDNTQLAQTASGLRAPSITDNARAWCAFFGISMFPVTRSVRQKPGSTAAAFACEPVSGSYAILPLWSEPWTLAKYRAVVRSRAMLTLGLDSCLARDSKERDMAGIDTKHVKASRQWLLQKGVETCMLFRPQSTVGADNTIYWFGRGKSLWLTDPGADHGR